MTALATPTHIDLAAAKSGTVHAVIGGQPMCGTRADLAYNVDIDTDRLCGTCRARLQGHADATKALLAATRKGRGR